MSSGCPLTTVYHRWIIHQHWINPYCTLITCFSYRNQAAQVTPPHPWSVHCVPHQKKMIYNVHILLFTHTQTCTIFAQAHPHRADCIAEKICLFITFTYPVKAAASGSFSSFFTLFSFWCQVFSHCLYSAALDVEHISYWHSRATLQPKTCNFAIRKH